MVANDSNNQRCYLLTHQLKRLPSPNLIIVNHDASKMPNFHIPTPEGGMRYDLQKQKLVFMFFCISYTNFFFFFSEKIVMKFDRILCDVPCSGDGTIRKNLDVWAKWNTANGGSLHRYA